ncbi:hypothetical protein ACROYT_G029577 [Oculina patagonica]
MACCSYSELVSGDCGSSLDNPTNIKCVTLRECTKEVYSHLVFCKVSDDSEIDTEWKLLLARAGVFEVDESHLAMNICPRHRDLFGVRWRSSKTNCTIPDEIASHKSKAKGLCGLRRKQSQFVYHRTQKLIPVGSKICKRCKEHLTGSLSIDASFQSFHDQPELVTPNVIEEPTPKFLTIRARKEVSSSSSDELTEGIRGIKITDESYLLSSDAGSEVSSTTDASGASSDDCTRRQKLNVFLEECGIQPLGRAWLAWREISERTKERYLKQEGAAPIPSTCPTSTEHRVVSSSILSEGWALRAPKKSDRFNTKQKEYLEAKFNVGQVTGRKVNPDVVAKDMRRARDEGGEKLFSSSEFLTVQQVTSFFSRLAAKRRQQLATEEDVCAATEEENFCTARESVLSSLDLQHPITYDQFNICALVRESKLNKLKVAMLQVICEALNLETPVPAVKRKAPYTALLVDAVSKCSCSDTG